MVKRNQNSMVKEKEKRINPNMLVCISQALKCLLQITVIDERSKKITFSTGNGVEM